jgi:P27 family predicted phage terminase small subunit
MKGRKPDTILQADDLADLSRAPCWLSKEAKAEWRRVAPILEQRRIITIADLGALESYCIATGQVRIYELTIQDEGAVIQTDKGLRAHPAVRLQADAMNRARLLAAELGLTPVSRSRPAMQQPSPDDAPTILDL